MHRIAFIGCAAIGFSIAVPAWAAPLRFGAINGTDDASRSHDVTECRPQNGMALCPLRRTRFGGLPIDRGIATLNTAGRVRSLDLTVSARRYDVAYRMLGGRYGPPDGGRAAPIWTRFDDGARIMLRRTGREALISFDFPKNAASAPKLGLDTGLAWTLLLCAGLGLGGGWALYRAAGAKRGAQTQFSMRDTLERRLRDGRGLRF